MADPALLAATFDPETESMIGAARTGADEAERASRQQPQVSPDGLAPAIAKTGRSLGR